MKDPISFSFCISDNYSQHLAVVITSILVNNPDEEFIFHVVHHSVTEDNKVKLKKLEKMYPHHRLVFHKIDEKHFSELPLSRELEHVTREMYYRYMLPEILQDETRTIYSDVDVLCVKGGIRELWETDLHGLPMAAIRKTVGNSPEYCTHMVRMGLPRECDYWFSGLLIMDLSQLRKEHYFAHCIAKTVEKARDLAWPDMDVINVLMHNRMAEIDSLWNVVERYSPFRHDVKMWHFANFSQKPWCCLWKNMTWIPYLKYLLRSPYEFNAFRFVWEHIKGFFWFSYVKKSTRRWLCCGILVWRRKGV